MHVSSERWGGRIHCYFDGSPELVVEVLSPSNTPAKVADTRAICLDNGCREFWVVDVVHRRIAFRRDGHTITSESGQEIPLMFGRKPRGRRDLLRNELADMRSTSPTQQCLRLLRYHATLTSLGLPQNAQVNRSRDCRSSASSEPPIPFLDCCSFCRQRVRGADLIEVVWFQLLQLVIGSSAISLGVLLGTYMGGMCLGSLLLPRLIRTKLHPLRVYSAIELGIGICAILALFVVPLINTGFMRPSPHTAYSDSSARGDRGDLPAAADVTAMGARRCRRIRALGGDHAGGVSWLGSLYGGTSPAR